MKLRELKLKNFGKFHDKSIQLQDGINVICGENESGKTTMHTFIKAMLFGLERGRGRASAKDTFSRYEPWEYANYYSGELRFQSNEKDFCLQRNFDKYSKSVKLYCETDGEELSPADGDLEMVLDGLTASSYENTLCIGQLHAATNRALAAELKNYATGYYMTGDSDIDVSAARAELLEKKKEADREASEMLQRKEHKRETLEQEAAHIWRDIHYMDSELKEVELELKYRDVDEVEKEPAEEVPTSRWRVHPLEIVAIIGVCILLLCVLPGPWNSLVTTVVIVLGIIYIWNRMKVGKRKAKTEEVTEELDVGEELISTEKLQWKKEQLTNMRKEKQIEYENLQESLRELNHMSMDYREVDRKREALILAISRLDMLTLEMQKQMEQVLNRKASAVIEELTDGRYSRLVIDDSLHMHVWHENQQIAVEQLSQGTLEQIYFALRMAVADLLYAEDYPIILDDTFAYYDDTRLERAMAWLAESGRQVLLFTCHHREGELLKKMNIAYTDIRL